MSLGKNKKNWKKIFENRNRPEDERTSMQRLKKNTLGKLENTSIKKLKKTPVTKVCITPSSKAQLFTSQDKEEFFKIKDFSLWKENGVLKTKQLLLLDNIELKVRKYSVLGIMGPSGAGKSLLLSSMTKGIFDTSTNNPFKCNGKIVFKGTEILSTYFPVEILRRKMGWIAQSPVLFPLTIRENVLFALRSRGLYDSSYLEKKLQSVLMECGLWEELKDRLDSYPIDTLSQGQAQRLCIARALILEPELLLMDEPTSALDPASTSKIEQLILNLSRKMTIILVSHSMSQIMHVAEYVAFVKGGKIIEYGPTQTLFTSPKTDELKHFISGQY